MLGALKLRVWQPARSAAPASAPAHAAAGRDTASDEVALLDAPQEGRRSGPASQEVRVRQQPTHGPAVAREPLGVAPPPVDAGAVAGFDWQALRTAVADCRACRLCESRKQTVFGVGHPQAHWMVVGEAPGAQEDEQGEPFVGAAGQLLDAMLHALGLSRAADGDPAERVFIANTLKCRPPGNRNPQPDEMQRCEPFLVRQIELVQPRIILAMGRFAVQALLRTSEPVGRLRGRVHRYQGVPLVVTYHPAYLLRNLPDKARAWEDLCLAADVLAQSKA
ncbi:MAG: uracil-DNA glycosylase [Rubrivivax sp.]|nr:uracil-DNA glycosylase [Rubrivivax sp.]